MAASDRNVEQWDRYWSYGNFHSFSQVSGGNYQGAVADFWRARFERLADGSRVLDIATGNGAIAVLALETGDRLRHRFDVHGTDLADIEPGKRVAESSLAGLLNRISFHGRTAAESLPFEKEHFDMACSQFGLEYSDMSLSIPELARVLKPGGRFSAIMHNQDSTLLLATREELAQLDFVLNDVKLYLRARNLLRGMSEEGRVGKGREGRPSPKLQKKQRALQDAMERVRQAAGKCANPNMLLGPARYVHEIFAALERGQPNELLGWLDEALRRVKANQRRLLDMSDAARRDTDLQGMRQYLSQSGLVDIELASFLDDNGGVLGWRVEAVKGPDAAVRS